MKVLYYKAKRKLTYGVTRKILRLVGLKPWLVQLIMILAVIGSYPGVEMLLTHLGLDQINYSYGY